MTKKNTIDVKLNFEKMGGLLPVVIQDYENDEVLMQGFMNSEAWELTLQTGKVHYWSRKKKRIWLKGEQSGHIQHVKEIYTDNDQDALLIKVNQLGGAVEDGYRSCFYFMKKDDEWRNVGKKVFDPKEVYKNYSEIIHFAIPAGSLYATTIILLEQAGYQLELRGERSFKPRVRNDKNLKLVVARAQEIPGMVQNGEVDIGLTGIDMVEERGVNITDVMDLGYNELGTGEILWVLAVPKEKAEEYKSLKDFEGKEVHTELVNTTRKFFINRGVNVEIQRSVGATEAKTPFLADAIVDICETGQSMRDNGLVPIYKVRTTAVHLFANNESMAYGWKRRQIEGISGKLKEAVKKLPENPKQLIELPNE